MLSGCGGSHPPIGGPSNQWNVDLNGALAALRTAPGPAPWYATQPSLRNDKPLRWCVPLKRGCANLLLDGSEAVLLALPIYARAQLVTPSQLLCSYNSKDGIVIRLFDANTFHAPLAESISVANEKAAGVRPDIMWASGLMWEGVVPDGFQNGSYSYRFPRLLGDIDELLFLRT
jgi:hypothetical protein